MIPIIYEASETSFLDNGLGALRDMTDCKVTEERNGIYEMDFDYPVDGWNFDLIQPGRIVLAEHDDTGDRQPFDIVSYTKPINGIVSFHAVHVSYRQSGLIVNKGSGKVYSLTDALAVLKYSAYPRPNPFTYETDPSGYDVTAFASAFDATPRSVRQLLGGIEGSILDTYGGEFEFDRFNVIVHRSRGVERDFAIRYGVNLLSYNDDSDYSESYNSCIPYWKGNENGVDAFVIGDMVASGATLYNGRDICAAIDVSDKFDSKPSKTDVQNVAIQMMKRNQTNLPQQTIKVEFVQLQNMTEYGRLADLFKCNLCDTISVEFPRYGMRGKYKIVRTVWDALADRYDSMELGSLSTTLADALGIHNTFGGTSGGGSGTSIGVRTVTYSFAPKSAGANGYFSVSWSLPSVPLSVYAHTSTISALRGAQITLVNASETGAYFTYYCPVATTQTISFVIRAYYYSNQSDDQGTGTNDYELLINKPQIESVRLSGDKSFEELGLSTLDAEEITSILS